MHLVEGLSYPAWQADESVREQLDGGVRERLMSIPLSASQKVLVIGAGWPRLAVDLADRGAFVTVVDADPERIRAVSDAAAAAGHLSRVTVQAIDYKALNFEPSAFRLIVAWDSLNLYSEQLPLFKKINRELKAGGHLFLRAWVRGETDNEALRRTVRSLLPLVAAGERAALSADGFLMPSRGALSYEGLVEEVEQLLVIQHATLHHAIAGDFADLAAGVGGAFRGLLGPALKLDQRLLASRPGLARFVAIQAVKEKHLGTVFKVGG